MRLKRRLEIAGWESLLAELRGDSCGGYPPAVAWQADDDDDDDDDEYNRYLAKSQ